MENNINYEEELIKAKIKKEKSLKFYYHIKSFILFLYIVLILLIIISIVISGFDIKEIKIPFLPFELKII